MQYFNFGFLRRVPWRRLTVLKFCICYTIAHLLTDFYKNAKSLSTKQYYTNGSLPVKAI